MRRPRRHPLRASLGRQLSPPPAAPLLRRHGYDYTHDGFFLRFQYGLGASTWRSSGAASSTSIGAGGAVEAIAIGAALTPSFVVYGEGMGTNAFASAAAGSGELFAYGAGVAYFFPQANVSLSGTVALAAASFSGAKLTDRTRSMTDWGLGLKASVAKEWWVSPNWGLGVGGLVLGASMKDNGALAAAGGGTPSWKVAAGVVFFSASYN